MELEIIKKKISTYRGEGGRLTKVSDELLMEILTAWESWSGPASGFYAGIGVDHRKMASLMGKAKKLKREGRFPVSEFKEVTSEVLGSQAFPQGGCSNGIELCWDQGKLIRFSQVEQLVDFLKKVA